MRNLLVAAIMVKNEEERIIKTIKTVEQYIDCLVVLDTGSTDNTKKIIIDYCKWNDIKLVLKECKFVDFSYTRNILLGHCHNLGEFVLLLDANEEVKNIKIMIKYLKKVRNNKWQCLFYCNYRWDNSNDIIGNTFNYYRIGIIRNNIKDIKYIYPTHEIIVAPKKYKENQILLKTPFCIYQDRKEDKSSFPRFKNDVLVLENYIKNNGENTRVYRYLCQSYSNLKDWKNVYKTSNKFIDFVENNNFKFSTNIYHAYLFRAQSSFHLNYDDFEKYYLKSHEYHNKLIECCEPYYELAACYYNKKDYDKAFEAIEKCCKVNSKHLSQIPEVKPNLYKKIRYEFYMELSFLTNRMNEYEKTKEMLLKSNLYQQVNDPIYKYALNNKSLNSKNVLDNLNFSNNNKLPSGVKLPDNIILNNNKKLPTQEELIKKSNEYELSIIVSYRNREDELEQFLPHMNNYCKYLNIDYHIYIVNQNDDEDFNKGLLYNIGVKILTNKKTFLCFHDVDTIPLKGTNYYKPEDGEINHLYGYTNTLGGVFTINYDDYININGFSNKYYNWGFEDNDFYRRAVNNNIIINNNFLYERYDKNCFKELNEDKEAPVKKMSLITTKKNKKIFEKNILYEIDGINEISNIDNSIDVTNYGYFTLINVDTKKLFTK